jgi:hypothetical protein
MFVAQICPGHIGNYIRIPDQQTFHCNAVCYAPERFACSKQYLFLNHFNAFRNGFNNIDVVVGIAGYFSAVGTLQAIPRPVQ